MSKKYLILSDAHIGLSDVVSDRKLIKQIIEISQDYDHVIFNGDMLEAWKFKNLAWTIDGRASKIQRIFDLFPDLKAFMDSEKCIVIIGNHDFALEKLGYLRRRHTIKTPRGDIFITHGNEANRTNSFDYIKSQASWKSITGAWVLSKFSVVASKFGFGSIDDNELMWDNIIFRAAGESRHLNEYANAELLKRGVTAIVTGHTHAAGIYQLENGVNYNCGFCRHTEFQGVEIFAETGEIRLFKKTF